MSFENAFGSFAQGAAGGYSLGKSIQGAGTPGFGDGMTPKKGKDGGEASSNWGLLASLIGSNPEAIGAIAPAAMLASKMDGKDAAALAVGPAALLGDNDATAIAAGPAAKLLAKDKTGALLGGLGKSILKKL